MRLLVFDDERGIVTIVATVARQLGWVVDAATEEAAFLAQFAANRPDAVFLDLQLGDRDGIEQLRFLAGENFAGPIVVMSGFDARVLASARLFGASLGLSVVAALEKPMGVAGLREALGLVEQAIAAPPAAPDAIIERPPPGDVTPEAIRGALAGGEMELWLQPVVDARDRSLARFEALVRWRSPSQGLVPPDAFVPVAEQDDATIDALTLWVIGTAADLHLALAARGFRLPISVNVSAGNLRTLDFPDRVAALLEGRGVSPGSIILEITESAATSDRLSTNDILTRLRLKGFRLAMDDFGTGFSSLKALQQLPFSELKIDRSFVAGLPGSAESISIVNSVATLARNLGLDCVAEGVETAEAATLLTHMGVTCLQGYHFGHAMPLDAALEWIGTAALRRGDTTNGCPP